MSRAGFINEFSNAGAILEIGPGVQPLFVGSNVEYLDWMDAPTLRRRFGEELGADISRAPETIHYVGNLATIPKRFDVVSSCHNVEHQPDLVRHLQEVANCLKPGGVFFLVVPDRRYCFDHFIQDSTIADVIGAHLEKRTSHTAASVVEHRAMTTHNDPVLHWANKHGQPQGLDIVQFAIDEFQRANGGYIDVHAWQFTPTSFRALMGQLAGLGLSPFTVERLVETPFNSNEFYAVLRRSADAAPPVQ